MSEKVTGHTSVRGLRLAYHTWGDPSRPAIMLVHGFQDHGQSYARTARVLASRWFLVAPDLRGHGESGWVGEGGDYYYYDYLNDVLSIADAVGLQRFGLVGHSLGGNVAVGVTAIAPERVEALVLLEGMGFQTHDLDDTTHRLRRWHLSLHRDGIDHDVVGRRERRQVMSGLEEAAERLRRYNERLTVPHALELAATFAEAVPGGVAWRFDPLHKVPTAKPYLFDEVAAMWRALTMPVLSLYGTESPWIPDDLDRRLASIADVRSGLVEGAGHNIHHDRPELLAHAIELWMTDPRGQLPLGLREGLPTR